MKVPYQLIKEMQLMHGNMTECDDLIAVWFNIWNFRDDYLVGGMGFQILFKYFVFVGKYQAFYFCIAWLFGGPLLALILVLVLDMSGKFQDQWPSHEAAQLN